jgi:hypothetical protein
MYSLLSPRNSFRDIFCAFLGAVKGQNRVELDYRARCCCEMPYAFLRLSVIKLKLLVRTVRRASLGEVKTNKFLRPWASVFATLTPFTMILLEVRPPSSSSPPSPPTVALTVIYSRTTISSRQLSQRNCSSKSLPCLLLGLLHCSSFPKAIVSRRPVR